MPTDPPHPPDVNSPLALRLKSHFFPFAWPSGSLVLLTWAAMLMLVTQRAEWTVFIEVSRNLIPRPISPYEYATIPVSLAGALYFAPKLVDLVVLHTRRRTALALAGAWLTVAAASAITFVGLATYPSDGRPPVEELYHLAGNSVTIALTAWLCVTTLGRGIGSFVFLGSYAVVVWVQATMPEYALLMPLSSGYLSDGTLDRSFHWPWIFGLALAVHWQIWRRAALPLFNL